MKKAFMCVSFLLSILISNIVFACDTQESATDTSSCVVVPFKLNRGVWFKLEMADRLRYSFQLLPTLEKELQITEEILKLESSKNSIEVDIRESQQKVTDLLKKENARLQLDNSKLRETHWYTSPSFFYVLGIVSAIVMEETLRQIGK